MQSSNTCWICKKLTDDDDDGDDDDDDDDDEKIRDHCHITGKCKGAVRSSCNIYLQLTKNVPVISHNLRGYDSHLIFYEFNKFDMKIDIVPNGLKYTLHFLKQKLTSLLTVFSL